MAQIQLVVQRTPKHHTCNAINYLSPLSLCLHAGVLELDVQCSSSPLSRAYSVHHWNWEYCSHWQWRRG